MYSITKEIVILDCLISCVFVFFAERVDVSITHSDFPAILAEMLDLIAFKNFQFDAVIESLQVEDLHVTFAQLVKFLTKCPPALEFVNKHRVRLKLAPLKPK